MASRSPTLAEVLDLAVQEGLRGVHTSMPGRVAAVDHAKQTVDVDLMIKGQRPDGTEYNFPQLSNVPLAHPRGGGYTVYLPVLKGDAVQVVFNEASTGKWRETGSKAASAQGLPRHSLQSAVAIPVNVEAAKPTGPVTDSSVTGGEHLVIGKDGGMQCRIKDDKMELASTGGTLKEVAMAEDVKAEIKSVRDALDAFITAHKLPSAHTTTATVGASATIGVITSSLGGNPPAVGDVGSSKVKVEE